MMGLFSELRSYLSEAWLAWNRFWFSPSDPATLSLIRVLTGAMLLYTHLVWSLDLQAFLGPEGWLPVDYLRTQVHPQDATKWTIWSVFFWIEQPWLVWIVHIFALLVFFCLTIGLFSRVAAILAFLFAVSYAHRISPGAFFGLDKINCMLALYLMLGPCGARYSLDRIRSLRRGDSTPISPSTMANLAIRLVQVHLCVIYLFSGLAKYQGETWSAGTAVWWAVANPEYQSLDMTWLADWPWLVQLATYGCLAWELSYCFLIWNRFTRPIMLWMAVAVHLGIAIAMGMITFGLVMLIANLAFLSSAGVRRVADPSLGRVVKKFAPA